MKFDNLYENTRQRSSARAGKIRIICIFLVVASVTALVIWKMIPAAPDQKKPSETEKISDTVPTPPAEQTPQTVIGSQEVKDIASQEKDEKGDPRSITEQPDSSADTDDTQKRAGEDNSAESAAHTQAPPEPVKGVPGPGDLPADKDKPQIPPEPNILQSGGELKNLEALFQAPNYAEVSAAATTLLASLTPGSVPYRKALNLLTEAHWQRFLQKDTAGNFGFVYRVAPGEYLGRIVRRHNTTVAAVAKANKINISGPLLIGQKLFLLPGKWQISISKKTRLLVLKRDDKVFMGFEVGIGRQGKTPNADFTIASRLKNPTYVTSDGRVFKHGEQGNELGDYFLKLAAAGKTKRPLSGYGIHGTPDETTVSRSVSNGCIRMRNTDVEKLYYIVPTGTPVIIRD